MTTQNPQPPDHTDPSEAPPINSGEDPVPSVVENTTKVDQPKRKKKEGLPKTVWQIATILLVPVVIALLGGMINWSIAHYSGRQKSVELAVSILREPLQEDEKKGDLLPLRDWAVDVVNKLSEVPFSEDAAKLLRTGQRTLPPPEVLYPPVDGYCEVTLRIAKIGDLVTFSAFGHAGNNLYVYSWSGDDGLVSHNRTVIVRYHTPGRKEATVRITSNGQNVYRTASILITPVDEESDPVKADVVEEH